MAVCRYDGLKGSPRSDLRRVCDAVWQADPVVRTDEMGNVMPLPATAEDQQKLKGHGIDRPTHRGGHPDWNKEVTKGLENIRDKLSRSSLVEGSDAYNAKARQMLEGLQDGLRIEMLTKPRIGSMPVGTDGLYA